MFYKCHAKRTWKEQSCTFNLWCQFSKVLGNQFYFIVWQSMKIQIKVKVITHRRYQIPISGIFTKVISLILSQQPRSLPNLDVFKKDSFFWYKRRLFKKLYYYSNKEKRCYNNFSIVHTYNWFVLGPWQLNHNI